ncbi:hypothetical protein N8I77_005128 [Diaporthe amygdali]|uniref:DUF7791 domain-containing protein n=1 Tax=Phomopsis amygdali TaxID=1214568 RepID=A0AAD9SNZ2_PHOAM|nr:hypothetical protein N8I77_005128 [Diaporthe amygdali]
MVYYIKQRFASSIPMSALMDQDQKVGNSKTVTTTLINRLVNTAEGVFLWLRLAVDDILDEAQDGAASVADTLKHFESLGLEEPDLEIMYSRILDKTPAQFRKQAYIMLELVLRSYVPISTYDFWLAESCARCQKLEDCLDEMPVKALVSQELFDTLHFGPDVPLRYATEQVLTPPVDSQERRLRSRCRGLLERSQADQPRDGKGSEHVVKFMHRSVKEFLIKTGMHARWAERTSVTENGYTFLAKYGLAQLTVERRRYYDPLHLAGQIVYKTMPAWFYYLHYFSMAEATTGTSQKSLLDSATEAFAPSQNEDEDIFGLYGSALSFGVVTNLLLYVRESLVNDDTGIAAELLGQQNLEINTLLHDVVRGTVKSRCYLPGDPDRAITYSAFGGSFPVNDLTQMANLLLENGANMDSVFVGYTPFQLLLSASEESYRGVGKAWQTSPIALVRVFLKHGQHPDSTLNMSKTDITPALHLCDSTMASILLKSGASVNSLDSVGLTALDVAFGARGNIFNVEYPATAKEAYNLILLLLRHGGRVTEAGILSLPKFHKALFRSSRYSRKTVDPRVLKPPRMEGL